MATTLTEEQIKTRISQSLQAFSIGTLRERALALFEAMEYNTALQLPLEPPIKDAFLQQIVQAEHNFSEKRARTSEWQYVDMLFQLTEEHVLSKLSPAEKSKFNVETYNSFLFFGIKLTNSDYTRTQLAEITREINKLYLRPVSVIFQYGDYLTISIVTHRPNLKDSNKDVLEKVTLIKDINFADPHRAHIEILYDLTLSKLYKTYKPGNFEDLQNAWKQTLDSSELNKRFFREIADWYFWAGGEVEFPPAAGPTSEVRNATSLIRLLTRLIFVWFLKDGLIYQIYGLTPEEILVVEKGVIQEIISEEDISE